MEEKKCCKCGIVKPYTDYHKDRTHKTGVRSRCKICLNHPLPIIKEKEGYKICTMCEVEKPFNDFYKSSKNRHGRQSNCITCHKEYRIGYRKENKDRIKEHVAEHYQSKIEYYRQYRKDYFQEHKEERNQYCIERRKNDPLYNAASRLRGILRNAFTQKGYTKNTQSYKILGASFEIVLEYLNDNLYGFVLGDEGLDIDHIIPSSSAETEEELIKLNHYSNLQLLPSEYNRYIKSDSTFDVKHFEEWLSDNTGHNCEWCENNTL